MQISFFNLEPFEKKFFKEQLKEHKLIFDSKPLSVRNAAKHKNSEITVVFILSKVTKEVLEKLPKLKLITTMSAGFDHIDLQETKRRKIAVSRVPTYGPNTVAEHTFALLQSLNRHIVEAVHRTRKGNFDFRGLLGQDLQGKTLGVIGTGHIGEYVIQYAKAFGMNVVASDARKNDALAKKLGFHYVSLEQLCKKSDMITIHVPLLPQTHHLLGKKEFSLMKKGVLIINTSRGPLIDTRELVKALDTKKVRGAALDVLELESDLKKEAKLAASLSTDQKRLLTLVENNNLLHRPNVIITPHLAFYTEEAIRRILTTTLKNIQGYFKGRRINLVKS